jgi:polar amino acid transport system substrate-binding protein
VENGKLVGFEIDFGVELAKRMGVKPEWRKVAFDSLFGKLNDEKIDVALASHTITATREKFVDFTVPYYCTGIVIVAQSGKGLDVKSLNGKVVSATRASTNAEFARKIPGVKKVVTFASEEEAFKAMQRNQADAYIGDRLGALALSKQFPKPAVNLSFLQTEDRIGMALKQGNAELRTKIDETIKTMLDDGFIERLGYRFFKGRVDCP